MRREAEDIFGGITTWGKITKTRYNLTFRWGERLKESELLKNETTTVRSSPKPRLVKSIKEFVQVFSYLQKKLTTTVS